MSDNLFVILGMIRAEMPEVPDEAWERIKRMLSQEAGATRVYIPAQPKRARLEALETLDATASTQQVSRLLGCSVRRAQQLRRLKNGRP